MAIDKHHFNMLTGSSEDKIGSGESEGAFNDFIDERLKDMVEDILTDGDMDCTDGSDSDIIVEMDDISPPRFSYGDNQSGAGGKGKNGPGEGAEKIRFTLPYDRLMELISDKLRLPDLTKEGKGKIKQVSWSFKTFGTSGVLLDRKRTFKRALKTSVGTGVYRPDLGKYEVLIHRRDKRFKVPERVEKPKFRAVVMYMGDISWSTHGERLDLEKRVVSFIHHWLEYNYGKRNVEHRFFVHDSEAHEVAQEDFFKVQNAGGTQAAPVFDMVSSIAFNEYDLTTTNIYGYYFGDGELFSEDTKKICALLNNETFAAFNRIGVVEVKPGSLSNLVDALEKDFDGDKRIRLDKLGSKSGIISTIKKLFGK